MCEKQNSKLEKLNKKSEEQTKELDLSKYLKACMEVTLDMQEWEQETRYHMLSGCDNRVQLLRTMKKSQWQIFQTWFINFKYYH